MGQRSREPLPPAAQSGHKRGGRKGRQLLSGEEFNTSERRHGIDVHEIEAVGEGLEAYLAEFSNGFGRWDKAAYLGVHVEGQHSDLQRKSAEPIAWRAEIPPRSLPIFLGAARWNEARIVDRGQEIVTRDHGHPFDNGSVVETGSPKKASHTAGVQRQGCGSGASTSPKSERVSGVTLMPP